tara:strand:+ start:15327 stop:15560 length:234 start_codon:yes stop_codon:yes gene_type:complete
MDNETKLAYFHDVDDDLVNKLDDKVHRIMGLVDVCTDAADRGVAPHSINHTLAEVFEKVSGLSELVDGWYKGKYKIS